MRELVWMQEGKRAADWNHTAALITHIRLSQGDKEAKFERFHPYMGDVVKANAKKEFRALVDRQLGKV